MSRTERSASTAVRSSLGETQAALCRALHTDGAAAPSSSASARALTIAAAAETSGAMMGSISAIPAESSDVDVENPEPRLPE